MRLLFTLSIIFILINNFIVTNECSSEKILKIQSNIEELNLNYPIMYDPIYIDDLNKILNPLPYQIINTPEQYNWKNQDGKDWTTPAKNQENCGSCWDFAAIGTLESIIKIRENRPDINPDLSEQYVLSCLPMAANYYGRGCSGGTPYKAFYYMMNDSMQGNNHNGALPESCFPYQADDDVPCSEKCENWQDYLIPITDCGETMLGIDNPEAREIIQSMIYQNGPIAAGINVTQDFINYWSIFHDENKYYPDTNEPWGNRLNHIIVIVGWKDDINIDNGGYWICKNSWGTDWGYDGFFNIEYGALFIEAYISWVDYQPNNQRPERPSRPIGKTEGNIDTKYYYSSSSVDPNGDQLYFIFDWGDGTDSGWIGPYESNEIVNISHIWNEKGNYEIKTKVKDTQELESEWSKPLTISMPMNNKNLKLLNIMKNYNIFRIINLFQEISLY